MHEKVAHLQAAIVGVAVGIGEHFDPDCDLDTDSDPEFLGLQFYFRSSGVNILQGPRLNVSSASATKCLRLSERFSLECSVAANNAFNHPNFAMPRANISVPLQAGTVAGTYFGVEQASHRQLEGRLRLEF